MASVWLAPRVAWRYLRSKKKHGAVGVITWISVAGVAVATAATICVLSVFNGFQQVLSDRFELLSPDVELTARQGRVFTANDSLLHRVRTLPAVADVCEVVQDRALAVYQGQEMPVRVLGVNVLTFLAHSALDSLLVTGSATFTPRIVEDENPYAASGDFSEEAILAEELGTTKVERVVVSAGVGMRLGIPASGEAGEETLSLIVPRRDGTVNLANPIASLQLQDVDVEGVYQSLQSDFDKDYVVMPIEAARSLLEIDSPQLSPLYVYAKPGISPDRLAAELQTVVPPEIVIKDRLQQHESQFRMSNIEKWITFLLLAFILLIASFNLISSLAMLVIDKQENLAVMHAMGATSRRIGAVFAWESGMVTLLGAIIGIALGVILTLLQQHFGLIRLNGDPGTLIVASYPARLHLPDLVAVLIPLTVIGLLTAFLTARFARSRIG